MPVQAVPRLGDGHRKVFGGPTQARMDCYAARRSRPHTNATATAFTTTVAHTTNFTSTLPLTSTLNLHPHPHHHPLPPTIFSHYDYTYYDYTCHD